MASSQVEMVSSMAFDRALKDHNRHDACKENIETFPRDNLNTCNIVPTSFDSAPNHTNTQRPINNNADTRVSRVAKNNLGTLNFTTTSQNNIKDDSSSLPALVSPRHSRIIDRWAARQAQETLLEIHHQENKVLEDVPSRTSGFNARKELVPPSCVEDIPNLGASSLVQIWEKRLNHFSNCTEPNSPASPAGRSSNENAWAQVRKCIRGRRAFNDLLMQLLNDRYRELNNLAQNGAVSKFRHRGRIQSLLRLKLLQRGVTVFDQSCHISATSKVNSQPQGSAIMQPSKCRERLSMETEHKSSALVEVSDPGRPHREIANNITQSDNSDTINQLNRDSHCNTIFGTSIHSTEPTKNSMVQVISKNREESHPSSYVTFQVTFFEHQRDEVPKEIIGASSSIIDSNANEMVNEVDASDQQYITTETGYNHIADMENSSNQQYEESTYYDDRAEEEEVDEPNYDEASYDWISPISRPRSYWEKLRQEWYSEILDIGSNNDEIRNLLRRRTVSTFLSSDFRERMDRLMESRIASSQTHVISSQDDAEHRQESRNKLAAFFHERMNFKGIPPDGGRDKEREEKEKVEERINEEQEEEVEEQEEESIINDSDHETGYFCSQSSPSMDTPSSSTLLRTWSYKDNEVADDYDDRVEYVSSQPPPQSESFYQHSRQYPSSTNHQSIEMEFLYDLRGQMDLLFQEMSELRKSLKICMDVQMQFQQLKNQEVYTVKEEENKFDDKASKRGKCGICYEKEVAAVLYRCGHMCTCFECANELQRRGENCPICKAPIIDVVRVHGDKYAYSV